MFEALIFYLIGCRIAHAILVINEPEERAWRILWSFASWVIVLDAIGNLIGLLLDHYDKTKPPTT